MKRVIDVLGILFIVGWFALVTYAVTRPAQTQQERDMQTAVLFLID